MLSIEQLEQLEGYRKGRLPEDQAMALKQQLATDTAFAEEAAPFNEIWQGFDALQNQHLKENINSWNEAWTESDEEELTEWHLQGLLSDENKKWVEQRMSQDSAFNTLVVKQKELIGGLQAAGDQDFLKRVQQWNGEKEEEEDVDKSSSPAKIVPFRTRIVRRLAVAATFLLVLFAGGQWYASANYADSTLATTAYKAPATGGVLGENVTISSFGAQFDQAHTLFANEQFVEAAKAFSALQAKVAQQNFNADDATYYTDNIEWNLLLARLASGDTKNNFAEQLSAIANNKQHLFHKEAQDLSEKLTSFWRTF